MSEVEAKDVSRKLFGEVSVDQAIRGWQGNVPSTKVYKHTGNSSSRYVSSDLMDPNCFINFRLKGYTILDNVFVFKIHDGVYLVMDIPKDIPPVAALVHSTGSGFGPRSLLSKEQTVNLFNCSGGVYV